MSFLSTTLTGYSFLRFLLITKLYFIEKSCAGVYSLSALKDTLDFVSFREQFFVRTFADFEIKKVVVVISYWF